MTNQTPTQTPPAAARQAPATTPPAAARAPLTPAPAVEGPPPEAKPLNYHAEFLIETAEGFHVLVTGDQLSPKDVFVWLKNASKELHAQGFKAVRRDTQVNVTMTAPAAAAAAAGAPAQLEYTGKVPEECPDCGGEIFDNRAKKKSGEMAAGAPFFACKDKDGCGWKKWPPRPPGARGNANNRRPANR